MLLLQLHGRRIASGYTPRLWVPGLRDLHVQSKERQREAHRRMPSRFPFTGRWQGPPWSPLAGRRPTRRRPRGGEFRRGRGYPGCGACMCSPRSGSERCTGVRRAGFLLHGKLARPALVATSRATAHAPSAQAGEKDNWRSACGLALTGMPVIPLHFKPTHRGHAQIQAKSPLRWDSTCRPIHAALCPPCP